MLHSVVWLSCERCSFLLHAFSWTCWLLSVFIRFVCDCLLLSACWYVRCCVSSSCLSNTSALRVMTSCGVEMTDPLAHKVCTEHQNAYLRYVRMPPSDLAKASARSLLPLTSSLPQVLRSVLGVGVVHLCLYVLLLRFLLCLLPKKSYDNVCRITGDEGISCRTVERVEDVDIVWVHDHVSGVWAMHSDHKEVSRSAAILWCVPILSRPPACLLRSRCTVETFPCKMLREPLRSPVRATGAHCMQSPVMVHGCSCYAIPRHGSREHMRSPSVKEVFGVPLLLRRCLAFPFC